MNPKCLFAFLIFLFCIGCQEDVQLIPSGFEVDSNFNLELVASEPLVFDPVDLEFDENGHTYILEMPGYPLRDEDSRLVRLEDKDGDGIYDTRQIFADNLGVASSFMPYDGGMLIAAPPHLLYLKDTNGDFIADERKVIMSGFSAGNLQHNFNGLTYGLDNWVYAANGGNNGKPYFVKDSLNRIDLNNSDFKLKIENEQFELVGRSSGGFEIAFDPWGRMLQTHNLRHISQLVFEGKYTKGLPLVPSHSLVNISDHEEGGLSRIFPIGEQETRVNHPEQSGFFSGACGITFYGGNRFGEPYNNAVFVADVVLNLVHMDVLSMEGTELIASRKHVGKDFIASSDRAFRPVNLTVGPDGALYLVDMYRTVIEHPEWIPDELEINLDLGAGKEKGRIYKITPRSQNVKKIEGLPTNDMQKLVKTLESENQWKRINAQRLLVQKELSGTTRELEGLIQNSVHPLARLHALWTLDGLNGLTDEVIDLALSDPAPEIRENALKIFEKRMNPVSFEKVLALLNDDNSRVQMQAALSISAISEQIKDKKVDVIQKLVEISRAQVEDVWLAQAITIAAQPYTLDFAKALSLIDPELTPFQVSILIPLFEKKAVGHDEVKIMSLLTQIEKLSDDDKHRATLVEAMARGYSTTEKIIGKGQKAISEQLTIIESGASVGLLRACGQLRNELQLPISEPIRKQLTAAKNKVLDSSEAIDDRLVNLQLIGLDNFENRKDFLLQLLNPKFPQALQDESAQQIWNANDHSIAADLIDFWPKLGPSTRIHVGNILLYKTYNHDALLTSIETGQISLGELNLDLERRRVLLRSNDEKIQARAKELFTDAGVVTRSDAIQAMKPALTLSGDLKKGLEVFNIHCGQCHRYGDLGKDVGPVLTEIHRKSRESLLHDILDPNAGVDTKYLNHQITTKTGDIYVGLVGEETDDHVILVMMGGMEKQVQKSEISEFISLGRSMMLEGLEQAMNHQDMADLLAFLQQGG